MNIFAQLPTDIAKNIYRLAIQLKNERARIKDHAIRDLFTIVREFRSIFRTIEIVTSKNITIHQKIVSKKYDDCTHIIYRRSCIAEINNITIVVHYKRTHYLFKNRHGNLNSRVPFDEKFNINRTDGRESRICSALYSYTSDLIDDATDDALIIRENDILR
jgi:hypothetical protein